MHNTLLFIESLNCYKQFEFKELNIENLKLKGI